jgi:ABC-type glycerol-3-phosphate transport system substrate-binding protein
MYDLTKLPALNFNQPKWQKSVTQLMTVGKHIYGMRGIAPEPRGGLFFNKRMFKEAGIDPESIYDMQKNGTWTWANFEKVCAKILRDKNNDGVMDVYPMTSFSKDFFSCAIYSNGATFVGKTADGKFTNGTTSDAFLEAENWATSMVTKYEMPQPKDSKWDYAYASFINGEAAMQAAEVYRAGSLKNMKDDYGFVCFPKGPKAKDYTNSQYDNVYVIPASYSADRANKIAFAFNLFTEPTPGYEDSDSWKNSYYANFRDTRAVDETIARMVKNGVAGNDLVAGVDVGDVIYNVYALAKTPAEAIEEVKNKWQAVLDEDNGITK